jgi:hypothetical protein
MPKHFNNFSHIYRETGRLAVEIAKSNIRVTVPAIAIIYLEILIYFLYRQPLLHSATPAPRAGPDVMI